LLIAFVVGVLIVAICGSMQPNYAANKMVQKEQYVMKQILNKQIEKFDIVKQGQKVIIDSLLKKKIRLSNKASKLAYLHIVSTKLMRNYGIYDLLSEIYYDC